jgi:hypothetical protein
MAAADMEGRSWTMSGFVKEINTTCHKTMDPNSVRHPLDRDPRVKSCRGVPMEAKACRPCLAIYNKSHLYLEPNILSILHNKSHATS